MSKKLQVARPIFLLIVNTLAFLFFMFHPFWNSLAFGTVVSTLFFLLTDFFICLIFQFQAQKKGHTIFYISFLSLIQLSLIFLKLFSDFLNSYSIIYILIIIFIFISFPISFKQMKVRRSPYILLFILVFLPILFYTLTTLFFYFLFSSM